MNTISSSHCEDVRRNTWQKQEFYKGRNVIYGTGWAGWGFESNITATAVNAAPPSVLRDFPVFEHDPGEMFNSTISTNMQNRILAKGIPALSNPTGVARFRDSFNDVNMNAMGNGIWWTKRMDAYRGRWLHTDIQNISFFFTHRVFHELVEKGDLQ